MSALGVNVGGDHHLKAVAPQFFCKLYSYLVSLVRGHFSLAKALISVIGNIAAGLAKSYLGGVELVTCELHAAVDPGRVEELLCFVLVCRICDHVGESLPLGLGELALSLLGVRDIFERTVRTASYVPYFRYRHQ